MPCDNVSSSRHGNTVKAGQRARPHIHPSATAASVGSGADGHRYRGAATAASSGALGVYEPVTDPNLAAYFERPVPRRQLARRYAAADFERMCRTPWAAVVRRAAEADRQQSPCRPPPPLSPDLRRRLCDCGAPRCVMCAMRRGLLASRPLPSFSSPSRRPLASALKDSRRDCATPSTRRRLSLSTAQSVPSTRAPTPADGRRASSARQLPTSASPFRASRSTAPQTNTSRKQPLACASTMTSPRPPAATPPSRRLYRPPQRPAYQWPKECADVYSSSDEEEDDVGTPRHRLCPASSTEREPQGGSRRATPARSDSRTSKHSAVVATATSRPPMTSRASARPPSALSVGPSSSPRRRLVTGRQLRAACVLQAWTRGCITREALRRQDAAAFRIQRSMLPAIASRRLQSGALTLHRVVHAYCIRRRAGYLRARAQLYAQAVATLSQAGADALDAFDEAVGCATEQTYTLLEEESGRGEICREAAATLDVHRMAAVLELEHRWRQRHTAVEAFERALLLGTTG